MTNSKLLTTDTQLIKRQTPEELEFETKRLELSALSERLAESELQFEELKLSLSTFQRRYFQEVGRTDWIEYSYTHISSESVWLKGVN